MKPPRYKVQFLDHVQRTQVAATKALVLEKHYDSIQREMERVGSWHSDAHLLDVGCGLGVHAEFWHARGLRVTAIDHDPDLITEARRRAAAKGLSIRYQLASGDRLPFKDGTFDVVYANSLLEHALDWKSCIEEWIRVLGPGGVLWIETTNVLCPKQNEFRWLPAYSWWPSIMKRIAVRLALTPFPALVNYSPSPALHWFSFFQLKSYLEARRLSVRDRLDCLDINRVGLGKRLARHLAVQNPVMRWLAYLFVTPLVVLAMKPSEGYGGSVPGTKLGNIDQKETHS